MKLKAYLLIEVGRFINSHRPILRWSKLVIGPILFGATLSRKCEAVICYVRCSALPLASNDCNGLFEVQLGLDRAVSFYWTALLLLLV